MEDVLESEIQLQPPMRISVALLVLQFCCFVCVCVYVCSLCVCVCVCVRAHMGMQACVCKHLFEKLYYPV